MAAVVSGNSLGLLNSSLYVLGSQGALGQAAQGRSGEQVFVNGSSGNLVIQNRDELLIGRGPDISILRTYNSQGLLDGDNNDNWRIGVYRKVVNLTGTVNTAGSTVTRVAEDGSESLYTYDTTLGKYVCHDGGGSFDTLAFDVPSQTWTWSWTDGTTQLTERYDAANGGRLLQTQGVKDQDSNSLSFTYNAAGLITQVKNDATGETTFLDYTGTNLTQVRTVNSSAQTLIRTRYGYDGSNRLTSVTTDLSPEDASIADGKTYVVSYGYDDTNGISKRVASLTQTDGNNLTFTYEQVGTVFRLKTYKDAANKTTTLQYTPGSGTTVSTTAAANNAVLSTTETTTQTSTVPPYYAVHDGNTWISITQAVYGVSNANAVAAFQAALPQPLPSLTEGTRITVPPTITYTNPSTTANANAAALSTTVSTNTNYNLNPAALTTPTVAWSAASVLAGTGTTAPTGAKTAFDQNGNGMAVWALGTDLFYSAYTKLNNSWSAAAALDGSLAGSPTLPNLSMSANGNALVTWLQNSNIYARRYVSGAWDGATTIPNLENLTTTPQGPVGAINNNGRAVVVFLQPASGTTPINLYANVYNGTAWAAAATAVDDRGTANANSITSTNLPSVAIDGNNNATVLWQQKKTSTQTGDSLFFSRFTASSGTWSTPNNTTLTTAAVTAESIAFDGSGNGIAIWLAGGSLIAKSYTASTNTWSSTATTLSTATASTPSVSLASNGNGLVTWVQSNNVVARRYANGAWIGTAVESVEGLATAALNPVGSINGAGQAAIAFLQPTSGTTNSLYVSRFSGGTWQAAVAVDDLSSANANNITGSVPSVAIDATGNVNTLWLQKSGAQAADSLFWNRFNADTAPYYTVPSGTPAPTWATIATALYGSSAPATQLQSALGNPPLTQGNRLSGFPATLTVTTTTTVPAYYTVQSGNTWSSIALAVYGDVAAAGPLQAALSNQALTAGAMLNVPASLSFTPVSAAVNSAALSTTDTQTTNYSLNSGALTNPAGGWAAATAVETSSAAVSGLLMEAINNGDAVAVWLQGGSLFASAYDAVVQVWSSAVLVSGTFTNISAPKLDVDHATGNAVLTWIDTTTNRVYANLGSWNGSSTFTWQGAQLVATATGTLAEASGSSAGILLRTTSGTAQSLYFSFWDGIHFTAPQLVATVTGAITSPQAVTTEAGVIQIVWRASDGTAESLYTRSYDDTVWGGWAPTATLLESSSTPVSFFQVETDIWTDTNVAWVQGNDIYVNWGGDRQGWHGAMLVATSPSPISQFAYSDSAGSSGVFAWLTTDGKVYAYRWGASAPDLLGTGTGLADLMAYSNGSSVVVSWRAGNDLYASSHDGTAWSGAALLETSSQPAATPRVAVANGQPFAIWQQSDGTANSIFASRYATGGTGSPYYTIQTNDSWVGIAQLLYGSSSVAGALQSALGNPPLTQGNRLTGFPATLSGTTTVTVPAYYLVPSGASWASITQAVYGTSDANAQLALRDALGLGTAVPAAGTHLTAMPASIRYSGPAGTTTSSANSAALSTTITTTTTNTVPPYYNVQQGNSWSDIAQIVYGDSQAGSALQTALTGGATPTVGAHLVVPQSLTYNKTVSAGMSVDIIDPLGLKTTMISDGQGQITQVLAPAVGGVRQSASYTYNANGDVTQVTDARGLVTAYGYDANGNRTSERDAAGNTITRVFGSKNELLTETSYVVPDPDGPGAAQASSPLTTRYAYDTLGHLRFVISAEGRVSEYRYNSFGQRTAAIQYTGSLYNLTGLTPSSTLTEAQLTTFVGAADKTKTERIDFTYDFRGQLATTTSYGTVDAAGLGVNDPDKAVTNYVYDQAGNLLSTVDPRGVATTTVPNDFTTSYAYDGLGRLKQSTDATGRITTTFYDDANKKTVLTSANGLVTTSTYDAKGELISVLQSATPEGVLGTTSYFYDADGQLRRTVDPTGISTHILYDEAGRKIGTIDGTGTLTEYRYDADNNLTRSIQYATAVSAANLATLIDAQGNPTGVALAAIRPAASAQDRFASNAYNSANQLVKSIDELGFVTQYFYDGAGRQTDVLRSANAIGLTLPGTVGSYAATPDNTANSITGDIDLRASVAATDWTPSAVQDLIAKNIGVSSGFSYRVRLETSGALSIYWSEDGVTLKSATSTAPVSAADGTFKWVRVVLDVDNGASGRAIKFYVSDDYNPQAGAGTWTQLGATVTQTGVTSIFNSVANLELGASGGTDNPFNGKIAYAEVRSGIDGAVAAKFDPLDAALSTTASTTFVSATGETWSIAGSAALNASSSNDRLARNFYDADGNLRGMLDGEGYLTEYKYDAAGQLVETVSYATATNAGLRTTGTLAQLIPAASTADIHSYTFYNAKGQVVGQVDGEGYLTQYAYDAAGNKTQTIRYAMRKALSLPGAVGSYASTPDSAANSVTADLDLRAMVAPADWTPAALQEIIDKSATDSSQFSYLLRLNPDGTLALYWSSNGTALSSATSTAAVGALDGTTKWLRAALDVDNGASGRTVTFYTSNDGTNYTQLGSAVTQAGITSVFDGTAALRVGARNTTSDGPFAGKIYYAEVRNGIDGTVVARFNPATDAALSTATSFTSATSEIWTLAGSATLTSSNPLDQVSNFTYTALNQLASANDFEGTTTNYTYDEVGNLTQSVKAVGTSDARTSSAQYDKQGRLKAQMDGKGSSLLIAGQTQAQIDAVFAANGTRYTYDADGRRTSSIDANGSRTLFYYDADGHLTHTINAAGEVRENKYNVLGQLTQSIAYGTRLTSTTLATLIGGLGNSALTSAIAGIANAALDSVASYTYTARGQVASSTDPLLFATGNTYDAFGDLTASSQQIGAGATLDHSYDFDRRGLLTRTVWDPSFVNAIELRQYDAFGRATQVTDANNNVRTQTYDHLGRVVTTTVDPGAGHLAIGTTTTYDAFNRVLTQRDALNNVTAFSYDKTNRSVTMTTPELVSVTTVHNRQGQTQSVTDGRGNVTKYDYDLDGNLKQVTRTNTQAQAISTTVNTYDKADRLTDSLDANGNTVHYTYDAANRVLTRVVAPGNLNLTTTYEYDAKGQTTKVTDARGFATQTQFDLKGQVTSVIVDPGTGHLNLTTTYSYVGKKTLTVTEGVGGTNPPRVTKYTYDNLGRRIQEQVDPAVLNLITTYAYDKNNNLVSKTEAAGKPEARTTRYVYDADDRLVWTIDALGDVAKNEYDAEGRVTRTTAYANVLANFATLPAVPTAADVTSRLTASADDQATSHVYDKDGREVYTIDAMGGVTQKVYDAAGNVIQTTAYAARITAPAAPTPANVAALVSTTNPDNRTTRAVYDAADRATFLVDSAGYVTQRVYDGNGNVSKEVRYASPLAGTFTPNTPPDIRAAAPNPPTGSWVVTDAARDRITRQIYDAAGRMRYGVDAEGYVTERRLDGLGNETVRIRYTNSVTVADGADVGSMTTLLAATPGVREEAHYDNAGRLFEVVDGIGGVTRYGLDALGNRTTIIDPRGVELAETNTAWAQSERVRLGYEQQLIAVIPQKQAELRAKYTTTQVFDAAGRMTSTTDGLGNTTRTVYDARGNAVKITDPRGNSGYFYYDANDKVRFHVDPMGYATEQRYDAFGNVKQETRYANPVSGAYNEATPLATLVQQIAINVDEDRQTTRTYNRLSQASTIAYTATSYTETFDYDAFGDKTLYKDRNDAVFNYEYDVRGNLKRELAPAVDVVTAVLPTIQTQHVRLTRTYAYDAFGNRTSMIESFDAPGAAHRDTKYFYDRLGRETRVESPSFSVFDRTTGTSTTRTPATNKTYDAAGNLVMEVTDVGRTVNYYDALNRRVASVDAENAFSEYEYDAAGNLIRERSYDARVTGTPTWQTRPTPVNLDDYREMRYRYNANNLRISTEKRTETLFSFVLLDSSTPANPVIPYYDSTALTTAEYNANGDVVRTVDGNGYKTLQFYDAKGNRILQVDPLGYAIRREYNSQGEVKIETRYAVALPAATVASLAAATLANLLAVNPQTLITALQASASQADRVTAYFYDRLGRVTTERKVAVTYTTINATNGTPTDQTGDLDTRYEYDGNGKGKAVILPNAQGRTDFTYDALGQRTQELKPSFQALNVKGQPLVTIREETDWAYDAFGNVAVQTQPGLTSAENRETRYDHDIAGRLRSEVALEGATTTYDYDIAGNVLRRSMQVIDVDGNAHIYRKYYAYDHLNRETTCQDIDDEGMASQLIRETQDTRYNAHGEVEAKGRNGQFQEQYKYDRQGHLFRTNNENGTPRLYVYDANGNPVLEVQAINNDMSTAAGPSGPILVTGPAQVQLFSPLDTQITLTRYDARNQATRVSLPPMEFGNLTSSVSTTTTGTDARPVRDPTDLHAFQPTGTMNQVPNSAPLPGDVPSLPTMPQATSTPSTIYGFGDTVPIPPATPDTNVAIPGGALASIGVVPSDVTTDDPVQPVSDVIVGTTRTVVEQFIRRRVVTEVSSVQPDLSVTRKVTTTRDVIRRTTTFTAQKAETSGITGDTLTGTWTLDRTEQVGVDRSVNVTEDKIEWKREVRSNGAFFFAAPAGTVTHTQPGAVTVETYDEMVDNGEGGLQWSGFYYVHVYVPPINYGAGDPVTVTYVWDNGGSVVTVDAARAASEGVRVRYDGHGIGVSKGNVTLASFGMDRTLYFAEVPLGGLSAFGHTAITIRGLNTAPAVTPNAPGFAHHVVLTAYGIQYPAVTGTRATDGTIEFNVVTDWLEPGNSYEYVVYDINDVVLNDVVGTLGAVANNAGATNYKQYHIDTTTTIRPTVTRLSNGTTSYHQDYANTVGGIAQNTYLRNLSIGLQRGQSDPNAIERSQSYNAFGEVATETDGRGFQTTLTYNDFGKLIRKEDPTTDIYPEMGVSIRAHPTTLYYYNELGQLVGTQDAVSNLKAPADQYYSTRVLVNGRVEREFDGDRNSKIYRYDRLGNLRLATNELLVDTESRYDRNGRLKSVIRYEKNGSVYSSDTYEYDVAGNRVKHTNALGVGETYRFDGEGRITSHISFAGRATSYEYKYLPGTGGIGGYEKRTKTDGTAGQDLSIDQYDYFGKIRFHQDIGGHGFTYQYNFAGWLKDQAGTTAAAPTQDDPARNAQHIVYDYYQNGYLKSVSDPGISSFAEFQYDRNGNRTLEAYYQNPIGASQNNPYQAAHAEYDELNRVKRVFEDRFDIRYSYDANGNRRGVESTYFDRLATLPANAIKQQNFYYLYDRMNRFVVTMGEKDATGKIVRGSTGYQISYDAAGRRRQVESDHLLEDGTVSPTREEYFYNDANNTLTRTVITNLVTGVKRRTERDNDVLGRVRNYDEFAVNGLPDGTAPPGVPDVADSPTRHVHHDYDADNLQTLETSSDTLNPNEVQSTQYFYLGNGILDRTVSQTTGTPTPAAEVTLQYAYEKWDGYKEKTVTITASNPNVHGPWQPGQSKYRYDSNGHIASLFDSQAIRTINYVNNQDGMALKRFEIQGASSPVIRNFYLLHGVVIGDIGTDNVPSRVDYAQSLADYDRRVLEDHVSRNGNLAYDIGDDGSESGYDVTERVTRDRGIGQRVFPVTSADFDQNYQPINDKYPGLTATSYVTRSGENLRSIAAAVWGDSSLWYLIADANGLSGGEQIPPGTRLTIPNVVTNIHNNSGTFRPYDPGLALGDTMPTLPAPPPPPSQDGCGTMGMIIVMIVVIVVAAETGIYLEGLEEAAVVASGDTVVEGSIAAAFGPTNAVASAAAGNLAGQAVGNMIGVQRGFSMESFMSSVFTAGVTSAIGTIGSGAWGQAATAAVDNAIGQEVNIITGQQKKFDWRAVAAAAVAAPVVEPIAKGFSNLTGGNPFVTGLVTSTIRQGIDYAAHRGRQPFNYAKVAADSFGAAIGASLAQELSKGGMRQPTSTGTDASVQSGGMDRPANFDPFDPTLGKRIASPLNPADLVQSGSGIQDYGYGSDDAGFVKGPYVSGRDDGGFVKEPYIAGQNGGDFYPVYPTFIHNAITEEVLGSRLLQNLRNVVEATNHIDLPWSTYQESDASFIHFQTGDVLPDPTAAKWNPNVENAPKELQTPVGMETRRVAERAFQIFRSEYDGDLSPEAREDYRKLELPEKQQISARLTNSWARAAFELSQANLDAATPESIQNAYRDFAAGLHPTQETSPLHQGDLWRSDLTRGEKFDHYNQENYNPGPNSGAYTNTEDMYRYFFVDRKLPSTLDFSKSIPVDLRPQIQNPPGVSTLPGGAVILDPRRRR